jgi:hypothetical protein
VQYEISEIKSGQYTVTINIKSGLSRYVLNQLKHNLNDLVKIDPFITGRNGLPIIKIKENVLTYISETIFPRRPDSEKEKVLLVLGNPATHSIKYGLFFFSKSNFGRHNIWNKLHDANLITMVDYSNSSNLSKLEIRTKEANEKIKMISNGNTSEKYLLGLTTFYSFPTPVIDKYKFSNVSGVLRLFNPIIDSLNEMESKRILSYSYTNDATLVFVQKNSYDTFKEYILDSNISSFKRVLYWPAVSRKSGDKSSGKYLLEMLEK